MHTRKKKKKENGLVARYSFLAFIFFFEAYLDSF